MSQALRSLLLLRGCGPGGSTSLIDWASCSPSALGATVCKTCLAYVSSAPSCSYSTATSGTARPKMAKSGTDQIRSADAGAAAEAITAYDKSARPQGLQQQPYRERQDGRGGMMARPHRDMQQGGQGRLADLAQENAPTKVLQLIGDPRSGVADDVQQPLGSTTCDMVHHQPTNEVYWYKYEFAADQLQHTHRDGRLSEQAKNLMYLLRAKDPRRWTVAALSRKFRIREQRVLAILALKEMEGASMEAGSSMRGALSGYACTVYLDDLLVDQHGNPVPAGAPAAQQAVNQHVAAVEAVAAGDPAAVLAAAARARGSAIPLRVDASVLPLHNALPRSRQVAAQVQQQLAGVVAAHGYDLQAARLQALAGLDAAAAAVKATLPAGAETGAEAEVPDEEGGDAPAAAAPTVGSAAAAAVVLDKLGGLRQAVASLYDCLEQVLLEPPPATEAAAAGKEEEGGAAGQAAGAAAPARRWRSAQLEQERQVAAASQALLHLLTGAAGAPAGAAGLAAQLEGAVAGVQGTALYRAVSALPPALRVSFLEHLPHMAAQLNIAGVDLAALKSAPGGAAQGSDSKTGSAAGPAAAGDLLGHCHISPAQYQQLIQALGAVGKAQGELNAAQAQLTGVAGAAPAQASGQPVGVVEGLQRLSNGYRAALVAVQQLQPQAGVSARGTAALATLKLMYEADPGVLDRLTMVEALHQLDQLGGDTAFSQQAQQIRQQLREAAGQRTAPAQGSGTNTSKLIQDDVGSPQLGALGGDASWDVVAGWLDTHPGGKVFNRGSGERQVARVPTFPAFEGQPLSTLDSTDEGQLSALNRALAKRQEDTLVARFHADLCFNLGLRGDQLWDGSRPRAASNLASRLDRSPLVVYDIAPDGQTRYPPLFVVETDGKRRPLNEQERVWQERRKRDLVPREQLVHYTVARIKRKPELA